MQKYKKYKPRHRNKSRRRWFIAALVVLLLTAPHAMIIRVVVDTVDPYYWVLIRFAIAAAVMLPFALISTKFSVIRKAAKHVIVAGICMGLATLMYTQAIYYSQASYVVILTMLTPVILILVSSYLFREQISRRKATGVMLALAGGVMVALLPFIAINGASTLFYPLATVLSIMQSVLFVIAFISLRKAKSAGLPAIQAVGLMAPIGLLIAWPAYLMLGDNSNPPTDWSFWLAGVYSALGVGVLFRAITVNAYAKIGSVSIATLTYAENLLAIALPIMLIGEVISIEMAFGGMMILGGMYLVESHRHRRKRFGYSHVDRPSAGI